MREREREREREMDDVVADMAQWEHSNNKNYVLAFRYI